MAESSRPWAGIVLGDAGAYTDIQWEESWLSDSGQNYSVADVNHLLFQPGVFKSQLNELDNSALAANEITIDTGRAMVNGKWYQNTATVDIVIPDVAANPRVDRIVLRKSFAAQTVRLTRIAGAEAAAPVAPVLVQVAGVTWDLPLWQVFQAVGAAVTPVIWRDERDFVGQFEPVGLTPTDGYYEDDFPYFDYVAGETRGQWEVTAGGVAISVPNLGGVGEVSLRNDTDNTQTALQGCRIDPTSREAIMKTRKYTSATDAALFIRAGWLDALPSQATPDPAEGIYFRHNGAGNWFAVCRTGAAETAVDTTIAPAATWRIFEIHVKAAVVVFIIDGAVVATIEDDIPAGTLNHTYAIANSGAPGGVITALQLDWTKVRGIRG